MVQGETSKLINGPGDSNGDREFNQFDLILVLQGGKYITGQPGDLESG